MTVCDVLDDTEGLVPFDKFFDPSRKKRRNLDVGGGRYDIATEHVRKYYNAQNMVYDPYNRSVKHNQKVLATISAQPVDTVTSFSVLNVILDKEERRQHIEFTHKVLRHNGLAFFTVWRGDGSGVPNTTQANREARSYIAEIKAIYGQDRVKLLADDISNSIVARK